MTQNQPSYQPYGQPQGLNFSPPNAQPQQDPQKIYSANSTQGMFMLKYPIFMLNKKLIYL